MKGYRFYLEYESPKHKRRGEHEGNVLAACLRPDGGYESWNGYDPGLCSAVAAIYFWPNSPVTLAAYSSDRLRTHCKRISEAEARKIHPRLFEDMQLYEGGD